MLQHPTQLRVLAVFQRYGTTIHDYLFNHLWRNHGIRLDSMRIEDVTPENVEKADVILIAACNDHFERERLHRIARWGAATQTPVLNHPDSLGRCSRQPLSVVLRRNGINTARVEHAPSREALLSLQDLRYPLIIRQEFSHKGSSVRFVHNRKDARLLDPKEFGSSTVAIEFFDYRGQDGRYHKYRAAMVGDHVVPRHAISSRDWNIHAGSRRDDSEEFHIEEDRRYREGAMHEAETLLQAKSLTGLDYAIVDYTLTREGHPFIFEMNPCYQIIEAEGFKREWSTSLWAVNRYCRLFANHLFERVDKIPTGPLYINETLIL
ncbi:MAG: ATP-grasp domain-containing protein [Pseudomonadota bacterium]